MPPLPRRAFLAGALALAAVPARAAPESRLIDPRWTGTGGGGDPDAAPWAGFLGRWLREGEDGLNRVDYAGAAAAGAVGPLRDWLAAMQRTDPLALSRDAAFSFWVNLYNAETVALMLEAWPVRTILEVDGGLFNTGPWSKKRLSVAGAELSLDDVEHGVLRPVWGDARVHYAVNCASVGCPNLAPAPWRSEGLDAALDRAARAYVNHPRGARLDEGQLVVSKIYEWFEADFGGSTSGVIAHLARHAEPDFAARLARVGWIARTEYDWGVNAA